VLQFDASGLIAQHLYAVGARALTVFVPEKIKYQKKKKNCGHFGDFGAKPIKTINE
jgi:hypothetical protein